jgi:hypothetical protein
MKPVIEGGPPRTAYHGESVGISMRRRDRHTAMITVLDKSRLLTHDELPLAETSAWPSVGVASVTMMNMGDTEPV